MTLKRTFVTLGWLGATWLVMTSVSQAEAPLIFKVDPALQDKIQSQDSQLVNVLVTYKNRPGQAEVNRIEALGGKVYRHYSRLPVQAVRIPASALSGLVNYRDIESVSLDAGLDGSTGQSQLMANAQLP